MLSSLTGFWGGMLFFSHMLTALIPGDIVDLVLLIHRLCTRSPTLTRRSLSLESESLSPGGLAGPSLSLRCSVSVCRRMLADFRMTWSSSLDPPDARSCPARARRQERRCRAAGSRARASLVFWWINEATRARPRAHMHTSTLRAFRLHLNI